MPEANMDADAIPPLIAIDGLLARLIFFHASDGRRATDDVRLSDRRQPPSRADLLAIMRAADIDNARGLE